jgi:hypothetical protein
MNQVAKKQSTEVEIATTIDAWGGNEMSAKDIVIPKLLLQQGLSEGVTSGKAKLGDYINSVTGEVLGSVDKPVEFTPFLMQKQWVIQVHNGRKWEYHSIEKMTASNENASWEFTGPDGKKYKRVYTYNFYILVKDQPLPLLLSFSSSSAKAGKELCTQMYSVNAIQKLPPPAKTMELYGKIDKNDDGTFAVKQVRVKRASTPEEMALAFDWFSTFSAGSVNVDSSDGVPF